MRARTASLRPSSEGAPTMRYRVFTAEPGHPPFRISHASTERVLPAPARTRNVSTSDAMSVTRLAASVLNSYPRIATMSTGTASGVRNPTVTCAVKARTQMPRTTSAGTAPSASGGNMYRATHRLGSRRAMQRAPMRMRADPSCNSSASRSRRRDSGECSTSHASIGNAERFAVPRSGFHVPGSCSWFVFGGHGSEIEVHRSRESSRAASPRRHLNIKMVS